MEWVLILWSPLVLGMPIGFLVNGLSGLEAGAVIGVVWLVFGGLCLYTGWVDGYGKWKKQGRYGDHPWYEWRACLEGYWYIRRTYNNKDVCRMPMKRFRKFFLVNPGRYALREAYIICDDGKPADLIIIVPRGELFVYYRFRRKWQQAEKLGAVSELVKQDVEAVQAAAEKELAEARRTIADVADKYKAPWDSSRGEGDV